MELTMADRFLLPNVLPKEGNMKEIIIRKDIKKKVSFTQKELLKYGVEVQKDQIQWNEEASKAKFKIDFTDWEQEQVKIGLEIMDKDKKLTEEFEHLYELFIKI